MSSWMVESVLGSESKETTSQPFEAKALPMEPVPEKSSGTRIRFGKKNYFLGVRYGSICPARRTVSEVDSE